MGESLFSFREGLTTTRHHGIAKHKLMKTIVDIQYNKNSEKFTVDVIHNKRWLFAIKDTLEEVSQFIENSIICVK